MRKLGWLLALVVGCAACGAQQDEASAPVRAGRLTYFAGAVEVQRADNTGVDEPVLNMPIAEGTRLVCGDYGQAEVEFEDGSLVRITPQSSVSVDTLGLQGGVAQTGMTVLGGLAYFELRKSPGYTYAVSAGGVAMSPVENAEVRVALNDGPAEFAVLSGTVRVDGGFTTEVHAGESVRADAKDASRYFLSAQIALESWDSWNGERDRAAEDETEKRTAARDEFAGVQGYGWSDLDANGTWYDAPGEGQVWQPYAADEGFDPYGYGGWVWQGVGYVWASGYQWGWTPFRCGRWEYYPGFGWGWVPDGRCSRWGSAGGVVLVGGRRPEHYKPTLAPPKGPVKTHPIIYVRGAERASSTGVDGWGKADPRQVLGAAAACRGCGTDRAGAGAEPGLPGESGDAPWRCRAGWPRTMVSSRGARVWRFRAGERWRLGLRLLPPRRGRSDPGRL